MRQQLRQEARIVNPLESQLDYPLGDGTACSQRRRIEVAPGIYWVRMPLPFALDHVNLWLLRDALRRPRRLDPHRYRHCQ